MSPSDDLELKSDFGRVTATNEWTRIEFGREFDTPPVTLASVQTFDGRNPADVRTRNRGASGVEIRIEEEQSDDSETTHVEEEVGYLAIPPGHSYFEENYAGGQSNLVSVSERDTTITRVHQPVSPLYAQSTALETERWVFCSSSLQPLAQKRPFIEG